MENKTAVEHLKQFMEQNQYFIGNDLLLAFDLALEIEKTQIQSAYDDGYSEQYLSGNDYYTTKYGKQ